MFARRLLGLAIVIAAMTSTLAGAAKMKKAPGDAAAVKRRIVYPIHLPEGPGKTIAEQGCLICHSATLITQQHKDSTAWEKSVKLMETWGAPVPADQHGELIRYLTMSLGTASKK